MVEQTHPLQTFQQQIANALDVFYEKIGRHHHAVSGQVRSAPVPAVDHAASEKGFEYTLEMPGVDVADIEVVVVGNRLTVRGENSQHRTKHARRVHWQERHYGRFERSFHLPPEFDTPATQAEYKNGVLRIFVSRKPGTRTMRRIRVATHRKE